MIDRQSAENRQLAMLVAANMREQELLAAPDIVNCPVKRRAAFRAAFGFSKSCAALDAESRDRNMTENHLDR